MSKAALIAGATGAIGRQLVELLAASADLDKLIILHHRPTFWKDTPKVEERVVDFMNLTESIPASEINAIFCCVGTTQKKAGSAEAFQKVDKDVPVALAALAAERGVPVFVGVSSIGARANAASTYLRTKGEMEEGVAAAGVKSTYILRPSLLAGEREEYRLKEHVGNAVLSVVGPLLVGPLRKYRAVQTKTVARAMIACALQAAPGMHVVESDRIQDLGA
jgi:uncharacterized protein YbjT (DUF2867 family)